MKHQFKVILSSVVFRRTLLAILPLLTLVTLGGQLMLTEAAASLTIEPITWNVIGLDSNNVNVGPNNFPVGARVCNTGDTALTEVVVDFVWNDGLDEYTGDTWINLRNGSLSVIFVGDLAVGECYDAYFEVTVTRVATAYNKTRDYQITADSFETDPVSTPLGREIYVEYLVSQARNGVNYIAVSDDAIFTADEIINAGGTVNLLEGETYWIKLDGFTATNGYEQIETFINLPNTIFQVLSVSTTYTADTSANVSSPWDMLYGDACLWINDPADPDYRSCLTTGKVGGKITVTYQVKIISTTAAAEALYSLVYDYSGSSYHYNSDYMIEFYVNSENATISKAFTPNIILLGTNSILTFTITNPSSFPISIVHFTDTLTPGMAIIPGGSTVVYTGCGEGTIPGPSPVSFAEGTTYLEFTNISIAKLSFCTISVSVTADAIGEYINTTGNLFIGDYDTGNFATAALFVYNPTAVTLVSFTATPFFGHINLDWVIATELNTIGYNLYRSTSLHGTPEKINLDIIPSLLLEGKTPPFNYQFVDWNVLPGVTYYYWLEAVNSEGGALFGPVQAITPTNGVFLPMLRH